MASRSHFVASLLVPLFLLGGCGDDSGDDVDDPAGGESTTSADESSAPHPCDLLTRVEVQGTLDALVKAVPVDEADSRTCVYEPGADAPEIRLVELGGDAETVEGEDIEVDGLESATLVTDPSAKGVVTAYATTSEAAYQLEVDAGGLGDPRRIAERLLALINN